MYYTIVVSHNINILIKEVNDLIKNGYKPLGGICSTVQTSAPYNTHTYYYQQALINENMDPK